MEREDVMQLVLIIIKLLLEFGKEASGKNVSFIILLIEVILENITNKYKKSKDQK